ncbi:protease modulator HflC [Oleisolibacter albus]|uniref:protease modulator HflC n=1 Tax=Oleisolibacter albus TaxID=2171757 RepID=UPI000DF1AA62|nr:protease modulator HflC [Oleisolibacter albus]
MSKKLVSLGVLVLVLAIVATGAMFTVPQTQQALVLQFGSIVRSEQDPGLKFKIPFVQDVVFLEKRVLDVDPPVEPVLLADQKRLEVDAFARYRITDPVLFYQRFRTEANAQSRLASIVNSSLRRVLGSVTLLAVLSQDRAKVMAQIKEQVNIEARANGMEIVDVRIRRADLPEATSQSVYQRMSSERAREAAEARAQGQEQAQQIRSRAERERTVILAEAQRDSQVLRGEGDNQAIRILAEAAGRNPDFYQFYRSLEAYRTALKDENTSLVLSPDSEFFRFFDSMSGVQGNTAGSRR